MLQALIARGRSAASDTCALGLEDTLQRGGNLFTLVSLTSTTFLFSFSFVGAHSQILPPMVKRVSSFTKVNFTPKRHHGFSVLLFIIGTLFPPLGEPFRSSIFVLNVPR